MLRPRRDIFSELKVAFAERFIKIAFSVGSGPERRDINNNYDNEFARISQETEFVSNLRIRIVLVHK